MGTPTRRLLRCARDDPSSVSMGAGLITTSDAELGALCKEESACNAAGGGDIMDGVEGVLEDCLPLFSSTRARFAEPRRFLALDKADNKRFLPFVHKC